MALDLFAWLLGLTLFGCGFAGLWIRRHVVDVSPLVAWSQSAVLGGFVCLGSVLRGSDTSAWIDAVLAVPAFLSAATLIIGLSAWHFEGRRARSWAVSGLPVLAALMAILTSFLLLLLAPQSHLAGIYGLLAVMMAAAAKVSWRQSLRQSRHGRTPLFFLGPVCLTMSVALLGSSGLDRALAMTAGLLVFALVAWALTERLIWRARFAGQAESLTGLTRLNGIEAFLTTHFAQPGAESAVLLKFDIDHLHLINESYGFETGDRVLRKVARELVTNFRRGDCVARIAGQQFLVACIGLPAEVAQVLAERARQAVARLSIELDNGEQLSITVSVGVSRVCENLPACESARQQADEALRKAKALGRNLMIGD